MPGTSSTLEQQSFQMPYFSYAGPLLIYAFQSEKLFFTFTILASEVKWVVLERLNWT